MHPPAEEHHIAPADALERVWSEANWSARAALGSQQQITAYHHRDARLIEVDGDDSDIAQDVDYCIQLARRRAPERRGQHAPHARRGRGWVAAGQSGLGRTPRPSLARRADRHRLPRRPHLGGAQDSAGGRYLGHSSSLLRAWSQILSHDPRPGPPPPASDVLAARSARRFFSQTCLDWDMSEHLVAGPIIVSELVTNAVEHADGDVDVFLAENARFLRIAVRDRTGRRRSPRRWTWKVFVAGD